MTREEFKNYLKSVLDRGDMVTFGVNSMKEDEGVTVLEWETMTEGGITIPNIQVGETQVVEMRKSDVEEVMGEIGVSYPEIEDTFTDK